MEVRSARPEEERALARLDAATWSPAGSPAPPPDPERDFFARYPPEDVLVAVEGEEIVGELILGPWLPLDSARHTLEVKGIAVSPDHRRKGIAGRLLDAAIERARAEGRRRLVLRVLSSNPGARLLYESRGFILEGAYRGAFLLDGDYVDDLAMALDLTAAAPSA